MAEKSELRERELGRRARRATNPPLGSPFSTKIVGVTQVEGYPQLFHDIDGIMRGGPIQWVTLHREPGNEFDPNAVRVDWDGHKLGYLTKVIALRMAPELDAGTTWLAYIREVLVTPGEEDQPGMNIRLKREE